MNPSFGRALCAVMALLCAATAAACNSSSPVAVDSIAGAAASASKMEVTPVQIDLGSESITASVTLSTRSRTPMDWTAGVGAAWLSIETKSGRIRRGTSQAFGLSVRREGLAAGDYETDLTIANDRGETEIVKVSMSVESTTTSTSQLSITPLTLDLGTDETSASVTLRNNGNRRLLWTAREKKGWISLSDASGRVAAQSSRQITITVDRSGRSPGTYSGRVNIDAGAAGSGSVLVKMTVPSSSTSDPSAMLSGQLIDQFDGHALAGLTVQYNGKSATTDGSGRFTLAGSPTSSLSQLTLSGNGVYRRITYAHTGNTLWRVVPASFSMQAYNDVARDEYGSGTVRWVAPPTVYIDSRPEGFSSSALSTWISEVKVQAADFVSKWSGTVVTPAAVIVTSNPPGDFSPGTIVIHFSDNSSDYAGSSTAIGYAMLSHASSGTINGSALWLRYPRYPDRPGKREGILGHEMGHAMGYGHMSTATPSFMEPSIGSKTDLLDFDRQAASFLYRRSPHNSYPDTDSSSGFLGSLTPSALPALKEWVCDAGDGLTTTQ